MSASVAAQGMFLTMTVAHGSRGTSGLACGTMPCHAMMEHILCDIAPGGGGGRAVTVTVMAMATVT